LFLPGYVVTVVVWICQIRRVRKLLLSTGTTTLLFQSSSPSNISHGTVFSYAFACSSTRVRSVWLACRTSLVTLKLATSLSSPAVVRIASAERTILILLASFAAFCVGVSSSF
jgi:hypothetical protein